MNIKIFERRKELVDDHTCQIPLSIIAPRLAKKYGCTVKTIYNDWGIRDKWMSQVVRVYDKSLVLENIAGLQKVIKEAWTLYVMSSNQPSVKASALKIVKDTYKDFIVLAQSLGIFEKKPEEFEQIIRVEAFDIDNKLFEKVVEQIKQDKEHQN